MELGEYLQRAMSEPWVWGHADCSTHPANWILDQSGLDPMVAWRGAYDSESGAHDLIAAAGGLVELFARGIDPIWGRVDTPVLGAVGVISLPGADGEPIDVGAIHTGKRWSIKSPRGLAVITEPLAVRAIWAR